MGQVMAVLLLGVVQNWLAEQQQLAGCKEYHPPVHLSAARARVQTDVLHWFEGPH